MKTMTVDTAGDGMSSGQAVMPHAVIDDQMIESMRAKIGVPLRIDHSVTNEYASRIAVLKFAGGIGDINELWLDAAYGAASPYGAPVAPPSFVIGCFAGIQFGWPGLGSFHSMSHLTFERPVYWNDTVNSSCTYDGFDGPSASNFAGQAVTDKFTNSYRNQLDELIATVSWKVINFERGSALKRESSGRKAAQPQLPHRWDAAEVAAIEARVLAERPRGRTPRYWDDVEVGDALDVMTKGPIGLTDEIAFVSGGGAPIPRLKAHAAALQDYESHPAWAFRDPVTSALEPIYSVHYNLQAARAMGVAYQYDVGFQRQCWQVHHLTHWSGDHAWVKECQAEYRRFVYLSDAIELTGEITGKRIDADGEHVVDIRTAAVNQRGESVMPGSAIVALPVRSRTQSPAAHRARPQEG
jgi:acyl dehydratase